MGGSGVKKDAFANYGTGANLANNLTTNAANIYGSLEPTLAAESATPSGFTPGQKANMNTAAQQSAGGSTAGAIGEGKLYSQRTRNAGGAKQAIGSGVRGAGENLSKAAVGTEMANAQLAQHKQMQAQQGLQGLNQTELTGGIDSLGQSNQALHIAEEAPESYWQQLALTGGKNLVNAGLDAGEAASGF